MLRTVTMLLPPSHFVHRITFDHRTPYHLDTEFRADQVTPEP
ncbi:MAG: hypothetical protein ABJC79_09465 [Acidimicrobiia bacterium]